MTFWLKYQCFTTTLFSHNGVRVELNSSRDCIWFSKILFQHFHNQPLYPQYVFIFLFHFFSYQISTYQKCMILSTKLYGLKNIDVPTYLWKHNFSLQPLTQINWTVEQNYTGNPIYYNKYINLTNSNRYQIIKTNVQMYFYINI